MDNLVRFRKERELDEQSILSGSVVAALPPDLAPFAEIVALLEMHWEDVVEAKRRGVVSKEFAQELDRRLMGVEEQLYAWSLSVEARRDHIDEVVAVSIFREAVDTAVYWNRGIRYLDPHLRT